MFDFISKNNLLSPNQSGLGLGDSYINQLLPINHEILSAYDMGLEARGIYIYQQSEDKYQQFME